MILIRLRNTSILLVRFGLVNLSWINVISTIILEKISQVDYGYVIYDTNALVEFKRTLWYNSDHPAVRKMIDLSDINVNNISDDEIVDGAAAISDDFDWKLFEEKTFGSTTHHNYKKELDDTNKSIKELQETTALQKKCLKPWTAY